MKIKNILFGIAVFLGLIGVIGIIQSIKNNIVENWIILIGSAIFISISITLIKIYTEDD